jgi:hypothetical protein
MSTPIYDIDSPYETDLYDYNDVALIYNAVFGYEENGIEYSGSATESSVTSTLNDELNRLANGGTYRLKSQMVDKAKAAQQWATLRGINLTVTDTVGVLNEIAEIDSKADWLDFSGVCNYIAGSSGLPAAAALRLIED